MAGPKASSAPRVCRLVERLILRLWLVSPPTFPTIPQPPVVHICLACALDTILPTPAHSAPLAHLPIHTPPPPHPPSLSPTSGARRRVASAPPPVTAAAKRNQTLGAAGQHPAMSHLSGPATPADPTTLAALLLPSGDAESVSFCWEEGGEGRKPATAGQHPNTWLLGGTASHAAPTALAARLHYQHVVGGVKPGGFQLQAGILRGVT